MSLSDGSDRDNMAGNDLRRRFLSSPFWRYALAVSAALLALELRVWLTPFLGDRNLYHAAWAAVAFSAWYCGLGPSILNVLTSVVGIWVWSMASNQPGFVMDQTEIAGTIGFIVFSAVIIAFGESSRRAKARSESIQESLRAGNEDKQRLIEQRTAQLEQKTAQIMDQAKLIDLANDAIFVRTADDRISFWNQGAQRLYGWSKQEALGRLTHDLLHTVFTVPFSEVADAELWEGELIQTKRDGSKITVVSRWTGLRDDSGKFVGWLEINSDITARKRAEQAARALSGRILNLQDDERRRIARELHDSLGQYLVSMKVNLDLLSNTALETQQTALLSECISSVEQALSETRTISHLLHPPLLDEAGFASAARWYIDGFAQRSAIQVDLDFPPHMKRMDRDVETALFRVLQEALTNVHRHSGGSVVQIALDVAANERVRLSITDNGHGISNDRLRSLQHDDSVAGVGLAGMRQRMRELGGTLKVASAFPGTTIEATIPLRDKSRNASDGSDGKSASAA